MRPLIHRQVRAAISLALLLFCAPGQAAITVIDYYRLGDADAGAVNGATVNATSQDSAGTKHLTRIGSPIYTNAVSSAAAASTGSQLAIQFSGSGQGLSNAVLSTVTDNFGIEAWARPLTASGNHSVVYNGHTSSSGWGIYQFGANYGVLFGGIIIFGSSPVTVNGWTHLALVRASGTNTLYVNGVAVATDTAIPNIPASGFGIALPGQGGVTENFNGQIDEVRVFTFAVGQFSPADLLLNTPLALGQVRKTSALLLDADANGKTNPGDTLRYTITITNNSGTNLLNVQFADTNFPNQTVVGGSIKSTPVARPDTYSGVIGNTPFNVPATGGVLANDSDPDGDAVSVVAYSPTSAHGGTVTVTNNGGFAFLPPVGYQGPDTFSYTITDGNGGSNTITVTLSISNMVWYVNNAGANGDGRQLTPFNSFASLNAANGTGDSDGANDFIYLFTGSGSYGAGLVLEAGQKLVGAGAALVVAGTTILPAGSRPTLGSGGAGVICSANNTIQGLNINATAGKGIAGTNVGNLTVTSATLGASGGAALDIDTGTAAIALDSASSTNSATDGIRLNALNGAVNINGGLVTGATGTSLRITGTGNASVTFPGHLNNTTGRAVEIANHTFGTITLSGNITNSGTGILIQNNSGGTITLSGTSKVLNTGANPAVNLANNNGTTIDFPNGGMVITTTSGNGFSATGGATAISATGSGNTINAGTGSALNVANTTIAASGLTFQRLASSGGTATGIVLDNTGTSGGLTVTGTGSPGSGGTLANKSGADGSTTTGIGLYLNNTRSNAFSWMQINDCQNFGLRGVNVTSVTLSNLVVNGVNGTSSANHEGSVIFDNAFGTCALVNSTIRGSIEDNFRVENDSGTLTAFTVSGCTIGNNSTVSGNIGVRIAAKVSAVMTASVRNCTFQGNRTDSINCDAGDNSTLTISILTNTIIAGVPGNNQGNLGIDVTTALNGVVNFNIDGNRVGTDGVTSQPLLNTGINVFNGTLAGGIPASMTGTVRGNTVVNAGAGQSGFGIRVFNSGYGRIAANVSGNTISNVGLDYGLLIEASSNSGTAVAPGTNIVGVTGNTVSVLAGALDAIRLQARGRGVISARINANSSSGGGTGFRGLEIRQANQTIPAGGTVYTATFNLEGLTTGLQNNLTPIVNYLKAQNPAISLANCDALYVTGITGVPTVSGIP